VKDVKFMKIEMQNSYLCLKYHIFSFFLVNRERVKHSKITYIM